MTTSNNHVKEVFTVGEKALWVAGEQEKVVTVSSIVSNVVTVQTNYGGPMVEFMSNNSGRHVGIEHMGHLTKQVVTAPIQSSFLSRLKNLFK
jgi:hypothetical protein